MEFSYSINETGATTLELQLEGFLDEFARLPDDHDFSECKSLYVDFGKVDFINSGGIKLWVNFIDNLERLPELKIYFRKARRMVVDQINLIEGFLPKNAQLLSVYVPVFCNKCENSMEVFQDVSKLNDNYDEIIMRVEDPNCGEFPKCRKEFEIDVIPEQYFRFLSRS